MAKSKDSKIYMPMGVGGLMRYNDEEKVAIKLKPKHVIGMVVGLVIVEIILKTLIPL